MNEIKRFKNVKNMPDVDGSRPKRLSLEVTKDGVPTNKYWKRRYMEDCLEAMDDKVVSTKDEPSPTIDPISKASTPTKNDATKNDAVKSDTVKKETK